MTGSSLVAPTEEPQAANNSQAGRAFDHIAERYDEQFTDSLIGRLQRELIWRRVDGVFPQGGRILDLGCGTGADAIHLAQRGCRVHAVDASGEMIACVKRKIAAAGLSANITAQQVEMETLAQRWDRQSYLSTNFSVDPKDNVPKQLATPTEDDLAPEDRQDCLSHFDGAISNFGALNCVEDLRPVAMALSRLIRPGGHLALCLISPFCLWETAAYSLRGRFAKASRRWANGRRASASLNGSGSFNVYYHSVHEVTGVFEPEFQLTHRSGVGIFVPPSYFEPAARRAPRLCKAAARLDHAIATWPGFRAVGDHTLLIFVRGPGL